MAGGRSTAFGSRIRAPTFVRFRTTHSIAIVVPIRIRALLRTRKRGDFRRSTMQYTAIQDQNNSWRWPAFKLEPVERKQLGKHFLIRLPRRKNRLGVTRSGAKADICTATSQVRFAPKADLWGKPSCLLWARSRHWRDDPCKKRPLLGVFIPNEEWGQPLFLIRPSPKQADLVSSEPEKEFRIRVRHRQTRGLAGTQRPRGAVANRCRVFALFR